MPVDPSDDVSNGRISVDILTSRLESASPEARHQILGTYLYYLVERLEPSHVGKVTGMLLELPWKEVVQLLISDEDLKKKVAEAMAVLRAVGYVSQVTKYRSLG